MSFSTNCIFCNKKNYRTIGHSKKFFIIRDTSYPVTKHHTLVITKKHISSYFDLTLEETKELKKILKYQKKALEKVDRTITGFNIGVNVGEDAGQSIKHCHVHLIPRRKGDVKDPRGGVRGVIPSKQKYKRR